MATPILTLTLNPALDLATSAAEVRPGPKLRCDAPRVEPGGGGINVARAVHQLGGAATALVALGGATGDRLAQALRAEGVAFSAVPAPGETRQSLAVTDRASGQQYRFVMPGAAWTRSDIDRLLARLREIAAPGTLVVLSGSQPPGLPDSLAAEVQAALPAGARLILDTSGPALESVMRHPVPGLEILRMDDAEAETLAGRSFATRQESAAFAADLVARGVARCVILARGAEGSVLAAQHQRLFAPAPPVRVVSAVGAGDSFVGALVLALARGADRAEALRQAVAAAAAACITPATELCRPQDVAAFLPGIVVEPLA
ncbi:1-phosphofructokinase family hexose kinase [Gemmobacter caeruleus]|uniref:1-phosphofructokinase family hexose kinase n=1 Tax=Gemmobacter caeruleus TaxID=2595004 RepID=UPI0011ECDEAB|nr:1-phosphofructokinase family hexose kinase [Gemmobacter caeruleus]